MARVLIVGDIHYKLDNRKYTNMLKDKLLDLLSNKDNVSIGRFDFCVLLGDILDKHEKIHPIPRYHACDLLVELSKILPTYVLIGNHDRMSNNDYQTVYHPFTHMNYPNLYIIDHAQSHIINGLLFTFVPYVPNGKFKSALESIGEASKASWRDSVAIFAHQEFAGAQMGAIVSTGGDKWYKKYPVVFSGHIHDHQDLKDINVYYVGMPYKLTYGESESKALMFVTFTTDTTNEKGSKFSHERYSLNLPLKKLIRVIYEEIDDLTSDKNLIETFDFSDLKIVISCTLSQFKSLGKHRILNDWKKKGSYIEHRGTLEKLTPGDSKSLVKDKVVYRSFAELLFDLIRDDDKLVLRYNNYLGSVCPSNVESTSV